MKICENCGREYGSDNPFCPFCDERYGVVILENDVISADGLPPYEEEFPVIGETGVKLESFADNRDEIFERNARLVGIEDFMPNVEVRKNKKTAKVSTFIKILCILAVLYIVFLFTMKISLSETTDDDFENTDDAYVTLSYSNKKSKSIPEEITFTSESGELKLTFASKDKGDSDFYCYNFEFTNKTDMVLDNIYEDFVGLEYADKFFFLSAFESGNIREYVTWSDGVPEVASSQPIKPGETVSGEIWLDFRED